MPGGILSVSVKNFTMNPLNPPDNQTHYNLTYAFSCGPVWRWGKGPMEGNMSLYSLPIQRCIAITYFEDNPANCSFSGYATNYTSQNCTYNPSPECWEDADCAVGQSCNLPEQKCVPPQNGTDWLWFLKARCTQDSDCPARSFCYNKTGMCFKCSDAHCCPEGTIWSDKGMKCESAFNFIGYPNDTPCTQGWPARQGPEITINERVHSCDVFEVRDPRLLTIAQEAAACYDSGCRDPRCHAHCAAAMAWSGANIHKNEAGFRDFAARYIIYGLGPEAKFMKGYYWPEVDCRVPIIDRYLNPNCEPRLPDYNANVRQLMCRDTGGEPWGWASDVNMSENSCVLSTLPAHADVFTLHTGTCADYSVATATLLRMVGFSKDEVYSVNAPIHQYNLVHFPNSPKWTIVDTVGNQVIPFGDVWHWCKIKETPCPENVTHCQYDAKSCTNDAGTADCPARNEVDGC